MAKRDNDLDKLITELVGIETENPPGNEEPCAKYIADWFADQGIDVEFVREPYENRPQIVVQVGNGDPTLVLNGHVDVVPAGDRDQWEYDPYEAEIEDGVLYGRGSADMKAGVGVAMRTVADLSSEIESGELDGSLVFHAAIGEETAEPGTKTLLEEYDGDYGVVLEPTGLRTATSTKGLAWYKFTLKGEPSHASHPDQGRNAILDADPLLQALKEYDDRVRDRKDELVDTAYSTVTQFQAGTKENVVPENATVTIDRRFLPDESVEEIDDEIDDLVSEVEEEYGITIGWERTRTYSSASIPVNSHLAEVFREHSATVAGVPDESWGFPAANDVRNFVNDAEMEAITWGPGDLNQAHSFDEHVALEETATSLRTLKRVSRDLLS